MLSLWKEPEPDIEGQRRQQLARAAGNARELPASLQHRSYRNVDESLHYSLMSSLFVSPENVYRPSRHSENHNHG